MERRAFILLGGFFVPNPLENGLYVLPPEERADALVSFLEAYMSMGEGWRPKSFEEWVRAFGKWIAEKYLIPYNAGRGIVETTRSARRFGNGHSPR